MRWELGGGRNALVPQQLLNLAAVRAVDISPQPRLPCTLTVVIIEIGVELEVETMRSASAQLAFRKRKK
jgi:hypothetical protein